MAARFEGEGIDGGIGIGRQHELGPEIDEPGKGAATVAMQDDFIASVRAVPAFEYPLQIRIFVRSLGGEGDGFASSRRA